MKAVAIVKEQNFILAVGGGSVIDGVKFISAAVNLKESIEILQNVFNQENAVPFGTVLTLPATGRNELWCCSND
jgi:NADP-dependent alcohol dehydrogenase